MQGGSAAWVWEDHAAILDAVARGDGLRAADLARRHAQHGEHLILDAMPGDRP